MATTMTDVDRSDEYAEWIAEEEAEQQRRQLAGHNGWHPDDPGPTEPAGQSESAGEDPDAATTWEPIDLGPYLRGEVEPITPSVGACRTDGQRLLYPGLEHAVIAHTAAGKTWFALACVTAELLAGNPVVYLHFEESSAASTVERLRQIGLAADLIQRQLMFVTPSKPLRHGWLDQLLARRPTLVVIDGVNEAMVLQGQKIDLEGWSMVRRTLIVPFKEIAAAVLECDHLPLSADPLRGDAYGTVHKGNVVDGVRFALVRKERFGRRRRGRALLYSTKDRNGQVELHGSDNDSGAVYLGTLVVDDTDTTPDFLTLYAPKPDEDKRPDASTVKPADAVYEVVAALAEHEVRSSDLLYAEVRKAGHQIKDKAIRDAAADLVVAGRFIEMSGRRGARGYRAVVPTSARDSDE